MKDTVIKFQKLRIEALERELKAAQDKLTKKYSFKNIVPRAYDPVFDKPLKKLTKNFNS